MIESPDESANRWLVDTNVLLRWGLPADALYQVSTDAINQLKAAQAELCVAPQNVAEFWNVITRPANKNGYGLTVAEAEIEVQKVEDLFAILEEGRASYDEWRRLAVAAGVSGVQVHDARLAALMRVHGVGRLLTFNVRDFARYGVEPVSPQELIAAQPE